MNPFGTIGLTAAIFFLFDSPVLVELFYMGQPPYSAILQYTVYIPQVVTPTSSLTVGVKRLLVPN